MLTRRQALKVMGRLSATAALLPVQSAFTADAPPTDARLIVTVLRGGLDGLAAVPPYADPHYASLRPQLVTAAGETRPGVVKLDGDFGLHPDLAPLKGWYDAGDMLIVHAIGTPHHSRSHVAGQNMLENGTDKPAGIQDGWLNRALSGLQRQGAPLGLAVGRTVPLILQGQTAIHAFVPSRLPVIEDDFLQRLDELYAIDPLFHSAFEQARAFVNEEGGHRWRWDPASRRPTFRTLAEATGKLLAKPAGPRVGVLESHGWDTHVQQTARLPALLAQLMEGLAGLRETLEPVWQQSVVLVVTEFGRTARENRSAGTDHGAGGAAFVLGGAVAGGRVAGVWPGLSRSQLFAGRDLMPTTDLRALFKAILHDHLGLAESFIEDHVFPHSRAVVPLTALLRI